MPRPILHAVERRWIVLSEDGRYATLGRETDPTDEEIGAAEAALKAQGISGWLAVMEGNPHVGRTPRLMQVRALGAPSAAFDASAEACVSGIMEHRRSR